MNEDNDIKKDEFALPDSLKDENVSVVEEENTKEIPDLTFSPVDVDIKTTDFTNNKEFIDGVQEGLKEEVKENIEIREVPKPKEKKKTFMIIFAFVCVAVVFFCIGGVVGYYVKGNSNIEKAVITDNNAPQMNDDKKPGEGDSEMNRNENGEPPAKPEDGNMEPPSVPGDNGEVVNSKAIYG